MIYGLHITTNHYGNKLNAPIENYNLVNQLSHTLTKKIGHFCDHFYCPYVQKQSTYIKRHCGLYQQNRKPHADTKRFISYL